MNNGIIDGNIVSLALFFIGFYGLIARRNIIKTIISFGIIQAAIILFFLNINLSDSILPPIDTATQALNYADPFPQALMITAIVIGITGTAISLTMFIGLYHHYGTTNWHKITQMRKEEK